MSIKTQFSPEEWLTVMTGPFRAAGIVVAASPSGITGLVAETQAMYEAARAELSAEARTPLLEAMAADLLGGNLPASTEPTPKNLEEARTQALSGVRQALWLVGSKAGPSELAAYQRVVMTVAQKTSEAAKEGGVFGIGGVLVDDKERAALSELQALMNTNL